MKKQKKIATPAQVPLDYSICNENVQVNLSPESAQGLASVLVRQAVSARAKGIAVQFQLTRLSVANVGFVATLSDDDIPF